MVDAYGNKQKQNRQKIMKEQNISLDKIRQEILTK